MYDPVPDLSQPSLPALAYILRHRELWPEGFEWNYKHGSNCAVGLSQQLWGHVPLSGDYDHHQDYERIYVSNIGMMFGRSPEKVAKVIDKVHAKLQLQNG